MLAEIGAWQPEELGGSTQHLARLVAMKKEAALLRDTPRNWFAAIGPSLAEGLLVAATGAPGLGELSRLGGQQSGLVLHGGGFRDYGCAG